MAKGVILDPKAKDRLRKTLIRRDYSPSTEALTGRSWVDWENGATLLGQPWDANNIPLSKLHQMRRDPMIAFGLLFSKLPLVRASWYIECEDARIASFVDNALRAIYSRFVFAYTNSLDFGYSAIVKRFERAMPQWKYIDDRGDGSEPREKDVWSSRDGVEALVWKPFVSLPPEDVEPDWNDDGEFNGIRVMTSDSSKSFLKYLTGKPRSETGPEVPLEHALWATNEKDNVFGSLWGYPRIGYAYRYWWSYWFNWALADRHFEKDADPPMVVYYPHFDGVDENGVAVDYRGDAIALGEAMRSGSTIALPSQLITSMDEKPTNTREWEIKALENTGNFQAFNDRFSYLDIAKLRAVMVPEQALMEGGGGTSSRNVAEQMGDVFFQAQAILMAEIDDHLNRFVIPQLVEANFGKKVQARKVTRNFSAQDVDMAKQIIQLIGNADPSLLEVNTREMLEQMGIPLLNPQQVHQIEKEMEKQAAQMQGGNQPPENPATNYAGINQFGLYYQPRDRITLADEHMWDAEPFDDEDVEGTAEDFRDFLHGVYADSYLDITNHIAAALDRDVVELAGEKKKLKVEDILGNWIEDESQREKRERQVSGFIRSVMEDAERKEIARLKLDVDMSKRVEHVEKYADARAAELLRGVQEGLRKEVRKFVASELRKQKDPKQIAEAVRGRFTQWPGWKADRLARTEAMLAYNRGALDAYAEGGVKYVKASDAAIFRRTGDKDRSDPDCITRHGKVFTIKQALVELSREHPNGTLSFSPVVPTVDLSFSVGDVPSPEPSLAYFDKKARAVYFDPRLGEKSRGDFMFALAEHLEIEDEEVTSQYLDFLTT